MLNSILNTANIEGVFNDLQTSLTSNTTTTYLTRDLSITKSADKILWADDYLTYTINIENTSETHAFENIVLNDIIDPTIATLVAESVRLNGNTIPYTFNALNGELTVDVGTITANNTGIITFQITKI